MDRNSFENYSVLNRISNRESVRKMVSKIFISSVIALCLLGTKTAFAAEADWEILNLAIDNPGGSNPEVLKNSILNILGSFVPNPPPPAAATTAAPTQPATAATTARPAPAPVQPAPQPSPVFPPFPIFIPQPMPQQPAPAPQQPQPVQPSFPFPFPFPQPQPSVPQPLPPSCNICNTPAPCKHQKNSLAEFLVDVPCPTTTPKPIRQIVVRVPCPTTTKKPCECQCCPCNPCPTPKPAKLTKKSFKAPESSEESSNEETKTIYKSYDPVKKPAEVKRSDAPRTQVSFEPRGNFQRVQFSRRDFDESFYWKS